MSSDQIHKQARVQASFGRYKEAACTHAQNDALIIIAMLLLYLLLLSSSLPLHGAHSARDCFIVHVWRTGQRSTVGFHVQRRIGFVFVLFSAQSVLRRGVQTQELGGSRMDCAA